MITTHECQPVVLLRSDLCIRMTITHDWFLRAPVHQAWISLCHCGNCCAGCMYDVRGGCSTAPTGGRAAMIQMHDFALDVFAYTRS